MALLDDFLSGEKDRVYQATWATIRTRDRLLLDPLVGALDEIRRATDDLDLGGALHPNRESLRRALEKVSNYQAGACWCANYPGLLFYNPEKEEAAGHVRILDASEPGWSMTYRCACAVCGRHFEVEQGEYHYTWWQWVVTRAPATP